MGGKKRDKQRQMEERRQERKKDRQQKKAWRKKMNARPEAFKLSKQYIEYSNLFDKQLSIFQVKLRDVIGDGNCLFRAFADQVDGNQSSHKFMRQESCRFIIANQQFFKPFIDEDEQGTVQQYVKTMRKDGQWGGHFELQALSECFRCIIVIHKRDLQEVYIRPLTKDPEGGIIHLAYFQHQDFQHYASIRDIKDDSNLPASDKLKALNKNMYEHLLYEDEEQYMLRKQLEEMQIIEKINYNNQDHQQNQQIIQQKQPYPNYPKNKRCKCGSKQNYKNCCLKQFQKRRAKNF